MKVLRPRSGSSETSNDSPRVSASWRNVGAFLIYGLIYIGLAFVASIPFGVGWIVLAPMVVGSCYAGWRTILGR